MTTQIDPERLRLLKSRLALAGGGEVVLPASFVAGMLDELEEAREARRAFDSYKATVDAFLGGRRVVDEEVGP